MSVEISGIFLEIAEFAHRRGVTSINAMPGCWEVQIDAQWWMAVNGHSTPTATSRGDEPVPPFSAYIEYNGWPAGVVDPAGGVLAAGSGANAETFCRALQSSTAGA